MTLTRLYYTYSFYADVLEKSTGKNAFFSGCIFRLSSGGERIVTRLTLWQFLAGQKDTVTHSARLTLRGTKPMGGRLEVVQLRKVAYYALEYGFAKKCMKMRKSIVT